VNICNKVPLHHIATTTLMDVMWCWILMLWACYLCLLYLYCRKTSYPAFSVATVALTAVLI